MAKFLLDTNIISDLIRHPQGIVYDQIQSEGENNVATNIIVAAELRFGALKKGAKRLSERIELILGSISILPINEPLDRVYAEIRSNLEARGIPIGANDLLIASHSIVLDRTLITANLREFSRVDGLKVRNWLP